MELDVTKALLAPGTEYPFSAAESLPPQNVFGETVTFDTVSLSGVFSAIDGAVRLTGTLATTAHAICAMCLKPADIPVNVSFSEEFRKDVNELEDEAFSFEGNHVPLNQLALTLTMLNLPMRFLCQEGCEGNEAYRTYKQATPKSSCAEEPQTQRPFEALQRLLTKDEEV